MATLGSLVVSLEANSAKFTSDMGKAAYQTEQSMRKMQRDAEMVGKAFGVMSVAVAGSLVVMVKSSLNAMDSMSKMAQKTGVAVEQLSAMAYAAGLSGVSTESLGSAMVKMSKGMSDASMGIGEAIKGYAALGINVKNTDGTLKDNDRLISELAAKFASFEDGANKTALAVAIFGKTGADLIPLLNSGADGIKTLTDEAQRMGLVMDTETSRAAEQFNDDMSRLAQTQTAFANAVTTAVLPVLQAIATEMLGASDQATTFSTAGAAVRTVLETFVVVGSEVAFVFRGVGTEIGGIAAQLAALASGDFKGFSAISDAMRADAAKARLEQDAFLASIMNPQAAGAGGGRGSVNPAFAIPLQSAPALAGKAPTGAPKLTDAQKIEQDAQRFVAKLKEQAETFGKSDLEALQYQLTLSKFPQIYKDQAIAWQQSLDTQKAAADELKAFDEATKQFMAERDRGTQRNTANVEAIRIGLMSEAEQQLLAHELILEELQTFHDAKFENVALANQLIEEENARHKQSQLDLQMQTDMNMVDLMASSTGQLYGMLKQAGLEQTAIGRMAFLATKALGVAQIILSTEVAAATALMLPPIGLGPVAGIPFASTIRAMGYASAGITAGLAIASAEGGYDIPSGTNPVTQLHEREMVLPKKQADVIRGLASNGGSGGAMKLTIVNNTSAKIGQVTEQRISPTERALIIQEAVGATAAQLGDPNSTTSRSMGRNFALQRSR